MKIYDKIFMEQYKLLLMYIPIAFIVMSSCKKEYSYFDIPYKCDNIIICKADDNNIYITGLLEYKLGSMIDLQDARSEVIFGIGRLNLKNVPKFEMINKTTYIPIMPHKPDSIYISAMKKLIFTEALSGSGNISEFDIDISRLNNDIRYTNKIFYSNSRDNADKYPKYLSIIKGNCPEGVTSLSAEIVDSIGIVTHGEDGDKCKWKIYDRIINGYRPRAAYYKENEIYIAYAIGMGTSDAIKIVKCEKKDDKWTIVKEIDYEYEENYSMYDINVFKNKIVLLTVLSEMNALTAKEVISDNDGETFEDGGEMNIDIAGKVINVCCIGEGLTFAVIIKDKDEYKLILVK